LPILPASPDGLQNPSWNIHKKPLQDRVARLASAYSVDVLMLAECEIDPAEMLATL
jgi:hypothetical protein